MASPTEHPLTPSQLNTLARSLLEDSFPSVWVEGEMGNIARPSSGHLYFTLKDAHAQIRCALFKPRGQRLHFQPQEGQKVWARGRLTLYETRGDYQLVLEHLEEAGEGALRQAFEALKAQLGAEGLFSETRKRPLPPWPRRIAVITSPTGAALQDVLSVLSRRFPLIEVDILPSLVQGNAAAPQLIGRLQYAMNCQQYDVILLTRGGGSLEDLWAFNDEHLVRTIAASPVPVVSAVGHETDVTLVDFVADIRAPTPSVAAELIVPHQQDIQRRLQENCRRLTEQFRHRWQQFIQRTDRAVLHLRTQHPLTALAARKQRLSALQYRLQSCWQTKQLQYEVRMQRSHALLRALHFRKNPDATK